MDGHGDHNNHKAGKHHFHKGPLARRTYDSKAETIAALNSYQKVGEDPAEWLPEKNRCWYVAQYIEIKKKYGLTMDTTETSAILNVYESCG